MNDYVREKLVDPNLPTVIAFSSVNTRRGYFKPFKIVSEAKTNVIFVNDHANNWYQNGISGISDDSADAAQQLVTRGRQIGNGKVFTFGTSMGAFGALLFASLGGADGALAFGAENELKMPKSRSAKHLSRSASMEFPVLADAIDGSLGNAVLFASDCDEVDLMSAYTLRNKGIEIHMVEGIEHPSVQLFDIDYGVGRLIEEFANGSALPTNMERVVPVEEFSALKAIPQLYRAKTWSGRIWRSRRRKILEQVCEETPNSALAFTRLAQVFAQGRDFATAERHLSHALSLSPFQYEARTLLGRMYLEAGLLDKAYAELSRALNDYPRAARAACLFGQVHSEMKNYDASERYLRRAHSLNRGNKKFRKALRNFLIEDVRRKRDDPALAEEVKRKQEEIRMLKRRFL